MKKYILSIAILPALFACNEEKLLLNEKKLTQPDSASAIIDPGTTVKLVYKLGSGLTQEEMRDDTVFSDGSIPTSWEIAGITDVKGFKLFLKQFQSLVLNNDKEQLSKLIRYPLGKAIKTENDFIKNYERIFTNDAKLSIANLNFSQIFRNSKGVMSEGGKVWFSQEGSGFRVIAINN